METYPSPYHCSVVQNFARHAGRRYEHLAPTRDVLGETFERRLSALAQTNTQKQRYIRCPPVKSAQIRYFAGAKVCVPF